MYTPVSPFVKPFASLRRFTALPTTRKVVVAVLSLALARVCTPREMQGVCYTVYILCLLRRGTIEITHLL